MAAQQTKLKQRRVNRSMCLLVALVVYEVACHLLPSLSLHDAPRPTSNLPTRLAVSSPLLRVDDKYGSGIGGHFLAVAATSASASTPTPTPTSTLHAPRPTTAPTRQNETKATKFSFKKTVDHTVVVTAYFNIGGNPKHPPSYFQQGLGPTMKFFQRFQKVHYFTDVMTSTGANRGYWDAISKQANPEKVTFIPTSVNSLNRSAQADTLVRWCKSQTTPYSAYAPLDKQYNHLQRVQHDIATLAWKKVVTVWIAKFDLIRRVIDENPDIKWIAWLDASLLARYDMQVSIRTWNNRMLDANHIWMRKSNMVFDGAVVQYSAGVMLGPPHLFTELIEKFYNHLDWMMLQTNEADGKSPFDGLCFDEETILTGLFNSSSTIRNILKDFGA